MGVLPPDALPADFVIVSSLRVRKSDISAASRVGAAVGARLRQGPGARRRVGVREGRIVVGARGREFLGGLLSVARVAARLGLRSPWADRRVVAVSDRHGSILP